MYNCAFIFSSIASRCTATGYTLDSSVGICYRVYQGTNVPISSVIGQCAADGGRIVVANSQAKLTWAGTILGKIFAYYYLIGWFIKDAVTLKKYKKKTYCCR